MKHTIKLDATKSARVEAVGNRVKIDLLTFGISAISHLVSPDQAQALGLALQREAESAADKATRQTPGACCLNPSCPPCTGNCNQARG